MPGILEGVRVLDFGRYIAGPYCGSLLADLGADVVRVEPVKGSDDRYLMPVAEGGEGAQYLQCNRGKQSLTLDMKGEAGKAVQRRLIAQADVVIANFSPAALRYFGLDYETVRAIKEDIILTTASAYGSEGPLKDALGFDGVGQAVSGAIHLTGRPGEPYRSATSYVDYGTALSCAYGTLAALIQKMRTGRGTHVEGSLAGTAIAIMGQILIEHRTGGNARVPTGNRSPIAGPSDVFAARDGWFIMQVIGQAMFQRWTALVGRPDLLDDPLYADDDLRGRNGEELSRIMSEWAAGRTREECLALIAKANLGAGPVLSPAELLGGAMGLSESFLDDVAFPGTTSVPAPKPPVRLSHGTVENAAPPPVLGAHTDEVLARYGFAAAEIDALRRDKII